MGHWMGFNFDEKKTPLTYTLVGVNYFQISNKNNAIGNEVSHIKSIDYEYYGH